MNKNRGELLQRIIEKIACVFRGVHHVVSSYPFKSSNLTRPYVHILFLISKSKDGLSVKDLAKALHVTSGAVTQFLDDLVEKKLIVRKEDLKDRRTMRVRLSKTAIAYFNKFKHNYFKTIGPIFETLSDKELAKLFSLIEKIKIDHQCK